MNNQTYYPRPPPPPLEKVPSAVSGTGTDPVTGDPYCDPEYLDITLKSDVCCPTDIIIDGFNYKGCPFNQIPFDRNNPDHIQALTNYSRIYIFCTFPEYRNISKRTDSHISEPSESNSDIVEPTPKSPTKLT